MGVVVITYFLSGIPFGLIFSKWFKGIDVRKVGSGNIGATNVFRAAGWKIALLTAVFDISKSALPVIYAKTKISPEFAYIVAIFAVMGHIFSPYLFFKGGKGVACLFGALLGLNPLYFIIFLAIFVLLILITRYVSLSSIITSFFVLLYMLLFVRQQQAILFGVVVFLLIVLRHKGNIERLRKGKEPKIGKKV